LLSLGSMTVRTTIINYT